MLLSGVILFIDPFAVVMSEPEICQSLLTRGKNVAIFGLSANPPTFLGGHTGIVRHLVGLNVFDEVWILPVYRHSYASKSSLELFEHRIKMCALSFEQESSATCRVEVKALEREVYLDMVRTQESLELLTGVAPAPIRMGSIDVVRWVRKRVASDCQLSLVLGGDTCSDLCAGKWKQSEE